MIFKPLILWPRAFAKHRRNSQFSAKYLETLDLLKRELSSISARNAIIQLALSSSDIRRDGFPRADARPQHPGVLLSFDLKDRAVSMPCDTFLDWRDNLRGIALSLEALRKVDRYGVTQTGEQYVGFPVLPGPDGLAKDDFSTREGAALWLARVLDGDSPSLLISDPQRRAAAYKVAARKLHPDAATGNHLEFLKIEKARQLLEASR